jgi:uncharacterized protein
LIILDSAPVIALLSPRDQWRARALEFFESNREQLVFPSFAVAEVAHFAGKRVGPDAEGAFLRNLASGFFEVIDADLHDYARAAELALRYRGFPLIAIDSLIVALAERLDITTIATFDRRHFSAITPRHCASFTLVP